MEDLDDWTTVLAAQAGIVTRRQLLPRGITDDTIRAHVAAGRWAPVHDGVYATFTGPLSPEAAPTPRSCRGAGAWSTDGPK